MLFKFSRKFISSILPANTGVHLSRLLLRHFCSSSINIMEQNIEGFKYTGKDWKVTGQMKAHFDEFGYMIIRGLLTNAETLKLKEFLDKDKGMVDYKMDRDDGEGRAVGITVWNHPSDDILGVVARTERVAGTWEKLLGGEVYHYHSKLIAKDAFTGGAFVWHQDYGYWYNNGCIFPNLGTTWTAIDRADRKNGCLKIIPMSHKIGRIDHIRVGKQAGADTARVEEIEKVCPIIQPELDPGDALFFHCNILHRSDQNNSPNRRWGYLCCYNRANNTPYKENSPHPVYTKLDKLPNSAIMDCDVTDLAANKEVAAKRDYYIATPENSAYLQVPEKME
ncbi:unnamed protein product [Owenia fusiformis]|uniref:Uncharacterized protein n=1 Tax=Owenia fusiformis TaxID=6347 RepID=A0A8J1U1G1_OWEFU|nr:unnamed protein product [Owenia fusiformis]